MSELQATNSGDGRDPHDPSPTSPTAPEHHLIAGELPGATPAAPMSAIHPKALHFSTPAGSRAAAAPTPGTAVIGASGAKGSTAPRSTVKVVKSRFMEPKSTLRPTAPKPSDRRAQGTGREAPPKRPPMQPSGFRSAQAKENLPAAATPSSSGTAAAAAASGGPQGPGSAAKGQAELRAQLAAFRERKTKSTPVKAPSGTPMQQQQQQQQPMSSASRHQSRGSVQTPSEHRPPLSASRTRGQQQQQRPNAASSSARKTSFGREAAGSVEKGKPGLAGKEGDAEGATQVASTPLQQQRQGGLLSSDTTPPSGGSTASAASKEKVLTQDSFMRERYLQHWRELQWHHLNARASRSLEHRKEEAEASLSRVAVMVAALTRHVTQQRICLEQSRAAAQLEQAVTDQMPELMPMQEFQAVLKAGVVATSESLRSAMLQVPLTGGASAQEGPLVMARALAAGEAALDAQAADVAALLGDRERRCDAFASGTHSLEDDHNEDADGSSLEGGVAELGSTCEALRRAAGSESSLLNTCAGLLSRLTELHLQEGSLQAHAAQLRRAT